MIVAVIRPFVSVDGVAFRPHIKFVTKQGLAVSCPTYRKQYHGT